MSGCTIQNDPHLTADEVVRLREESGWDGDISEWKKCLAQNMVNVSARTDTGRVIGVGFISGTVRHAQVVDMVVSPDFRKQGIGAQILDCLCEYAAEQNIRYFGLTYDTDFPWLKTFYEKHDFQSVDFAMWHKNSLK
ncbi:MAG TPA: GNAT family N-acetyltransferase [Candidatus Saccharimonadales bacterium]|jgi:GNAT superfamily N-acetyltransferase